MPEPRRAAIEQAAAEPGLVQLGARFRHAQANRVRRMRDNHALTFAPNPRGVEGAPRGLRSLSRPNSLPLRALSATAPPGEPPRLRLPAARAG
jgi:hypothetical protein